MVLDELISGLDKIGESRRKLRPPEEGDEYIVINCWTSERTIPLEFSHNVVADYFFNAQPQRQRVYFPPMSDFFYPYRPFFQSEEQFLEVHRTLAELVINAFRHGNRSDTSKSFHFNIYYGRNGLIIELRDEGAGIPEDFIRMVQQREFPYNKNREGHKGLLNLVNGLKKGHINEIHFSWSRNAIYLLFLTEKMRAPGETYARDLLYKAAENWMNH